MGRGERKGLTAASQLETNMVEIGASCYRKNKNSTKICYRLSAINECFLNSPSVGQVSNF